MSGGSVPAGKSTYESTVAVANTAEVTTFADRFGYVAVTNIGSSGVLYATADGSTPQTSGAGTALAVAPNETRVIANGLPLWFQSSRVISQGNDNAQQESKAGQMANPGSKVSVVSATAGLQYSIEGSG